MVKDTFTQIIREQHHGKRFKGVDVDGMKVMEGMIWFDKDKPLYYFLIQEKRNGGHTKITHDASEEYKKLFPNCDLEKIGAWGLSVKFKIKNLEIQEIGIVNNYSLW